MLEAATQLWHVTAVPVVKPKTRSSTFNTNILEAAGNVEMRALSRTTPKENAFKFYVLSSSDASFVVVSAL